jgi:glycerol-3-phosphate dehydrogenase (NAD(P)+)
MNIAILGGGSWGTALAVHLAKKKFNIKVWEFFEEQAKEMQEKRHCKLLPGANLPENIFVSSNMQEVLKDSELVLIVVPSDKVESTVVSARAYIQDKPIVICSKGFASDLRLLSDVVAEQVSGSVYCLYGPTHAEEVCKGIFSGIVLAGEDTGGLKEVFESDVLKVDVTGDLIGVQVAAALKNILAVLNGILDGAGYGDNTSAYVLTKGLAEISQVGLHMDAHQETFYGLAGMGDVIVTCSSEHSRNRRVGFEIGKGRKLQEVLKEMNMVAEGVSTAKIMPQLVDKYELELPLLMGTYQILFENKDIKEILNLL